MIRAGDKGNGLRYISPVVKQDYEVDLNVQGMQWRFVLFENWNDPYFIGCDAIEFFDREGKKMDVQAAGVSVCAVPHSVNDLAGSNGGDPRTPDKLLCGPQAWGAEGGGAVWPSWLAPLSRCMTPQERNAAADRLQKAVGTDPRLRALTEGRYSYPVDNTVFVHFDHPACVGCVKIFNYSKNPARGIKEFAIFVDGMLCYMGSLLPADQ